MHTAVYEGGLFVINGRHKAEKNNNNHVSSHYSQVFPQQTGYRGSRVSLFCSALAAKSHFSQVRAFLTLDTFKPMPDLKFLHNKYLLLSFAVLVPRRLV